MTGSIDKKKQTNKSNEEIRMDMMVKLELMPFRFISIFLISNSVSVLVSCCQLFSQFNSHSVCVRLYVFLHLLLMLTADPGAASGTSNCC